MISSVPLAKVERKSFTSAFPAEKWGIAAGFGTEELAKSCTKGLGDIDIECLEELGREDAEDPRRGVSAEQGVPGARAKTVEFHGLWNSALRKLLDGSCGLKDFTQSFFSTS